MKSRHRFTTYVSLLALTTAFILLCQQSAYAFPEKSQLQPFGQGAVANGYARIEGKSLVEYTETYLDDPLNDTIRASYWSSNRELISYKELNFSDNPNIPDNFQVIDYRRERGYRITVNSSVANVKVVDVSDNNERILLDKDVVIDDATVIDASFHRFVISNWDRLLSGKSVKIKFLQIDKARLVPLKIKATQCDTPGTACFKITLDNFLLQGLVPNIFMKYEVATQRLLRYTGIGPVTKMSGKGLPADISYEYLQ